MMNYDDALIKVAERTQNNRKQNRQDTMQRRHQVTEIYGQEYTAQGDSNTPAIVYLPVVRTLYITKLWSFKFVFLDLRCLLKVEKLQMHH